ncbi:unnamed protein product [Hyaloperonospora brassicae]|uniref:Symplekin C-terminal domain-containing protein n=1 Tax=Hyaloperonospora brassicae TaxID=162125 RepID=A0AAV0UVT2_HYABA|nr:unnamed protein product [Hyaloperonospora brassicae]
MKNVELAAQVRSFVKLANLTQTSQLHAWNLKSLQRALQWAHAAEDAVSDGEFLQSGIDMQIRDWFPVATLPTLPLDVTLTADALRHARVHLLQSILHSPFLASHPARSEVLCAVLNELQTSREDAATTLSMEELEKHAPHSALLTEKVVGASRMKVLLAIARRMSESCKCVRVQVLTGWIEVLPLKSYAFSPRTLQLKSMATTLQRNVGDARAANKPGTYQTFLKDLRECFEAPESQEVREVVLLMLVMCEWPREEPSQLRGMKEDLVTIVRGWIACKPIRFWTFRPWLAAMVASQSEDLARAYVCKLFEAGLLPPWEGEFAERVATLVLQPKNVEHVLEPFLINLDLRLQHTYFNVKLDP